MAEKTDIPQEAIDLLLEYREHYRQYTTINYRRGTNGERGLHGQYRTVRAKMNKVKQKLEATTDYTVITSNYEAYLKEN